MIYYSPSSSSSSSSTFLSFSIKFFLLQLLRYLTMRDWLALPLSPSTANPNPNNEGGLVSSPTGSDGDAQNYDIVNTKSATTTDGELIDGDVQTDEEEPEPANRRSSWLSVLSVFGVSNRMKKSSKMRKRLGSRSNSSATVSTTVSSSSSSAAAMPKEPIIEEASEFKEQQPEHEQIPMPLCMNKQEEEENKKEQREGERDEQVTQNARATILPDMITENDSEDSPAQTSGKEISATATTTTTTTTTPPPPPSPTTTAAAEQKEQEVEELLVSSSPSLHRNSISSANSSNISTEDDYDDNTTPTHSQILSTPSRNGNSPDNHNATTNKLPASLDTTVYTEVYWNHGGNKVQVTGEFDNWSVSINMIKDTEHPHRHIAEIPIPNPSKDMEFKFVVDGEWRYAQDIPHRTDWRGNINNVIYKKDTSN